MISFFAIRFYSFFFVVQRLVITFNKRTSHFLFLKRFQMSTEKPLIIVCGATGNQGGSVISHLLKQGKWRIRGICRDTSSIKAQELTQKGVELVSCNLDNASDLIHAFRGAHGVFAFTNVRFFNLLKSC